MNPLIFIELTPANSHQPDTLTINAGRIAAMKDLPAGPGALPMTDVWIAGVEHPFRVKGSSQDIVAKIVAVANDAAPPELSEFFDGLQVPSRRKRKQR